MAYAGLVATCVSFLLGYLTITAILNRDSRPHPCLQLVLGGGLGLGLSAQLTFISFWIFNRLHPTFVTGSHIVLIFGLLTLILARRPVVTQPVSRQRRSSAIVLLSVLCLALIPAILWARLFPQGGWDAWQVWNFKAKFLLLGGENWQNMLLPQLWRSSPHYPLLLPLINTWGWIWTGSPVPEQPMIVAVVWTGLTGGLVGFALYDRYRHPLAMLPPLWLLTHPFFLTLSTSQYSDIVLAYYLLAATYCVWRYRTSSRLAWLFLGGIFTGFLSFTKPEGSVAAIVLLGIATLIVHQVRHSPRHSIRGYTNSAPARLATWLVFVSGCVLTGANTFVFQMFYAPLNQTFINGLVSSNHPLTGQRSQMIFAFLVIELISQKWLGVWILLLAGVVCGGRKCWSSSRWVFPAVSLTYFAVVLAYYHINTYFSIAWWLQVTLHRILFTLIPVLTWWIFSALLSHRSQWRKHTSGLV